MLLNKWLFFRIFSISSNEIWLFIFSLMYRIPMILRYNFNCSNLDKETFSTSEGSEFFTYFSISCRSDPEETLLVVITIPLLSTWIKSAIVLDLIVLRAWLILATCKLEFLMNSFAILLFIGTITCFLERPLVVMLIFSLTLSFEPLMTLCISLILSISLVMFFRVAGLSCLGKEVAFAYNFFC